MQPSADIATRKSAGLATLRRYYDDPMLGAREARAAGQGVVARTSNTVPLEPILATGRLPVLLKPPLGRATPQADAVIDPILPPSLSAFYEAAVEGAYSELDLLVLGRGDDKLWYYLKEAQRLGRARKLPALHIFDLMMSRRDAVRAYNVQQFGALCAALERASGRAITETALADALSATGRVRRLQRRLVEVRRTGRMVGAEAMVALGASYFMRPDAYAETLATYLDELPAADAGGRPRLLVITSEPLSYLDLHMRLEAAGGRVVAEDDWWGARAPGDPRADAASPRETVFENAWLGVADADVYPPEAREAWALSQAASVDAVMFYVPPSDRTFGWDYPRLKREVEALGKPTLLLRQDATDPAGGDAIEAATAAFLTAGA